MTDTQNDTPEECPPEVMARVKAAVADEVAARMTVPALKKSQQRRVLALESARLLLQSPAPFSRPPAAADLVTVADFILELEDWTA